MKKLVYFLTFFVFLFSKTAFSQFYIVGQDPASVRWKEVQSPHFKIIFPEGYAAGARLYANTLEVSRKATLSTWLTKDVKPFTIVLHTKSTWANAMVLPAPLHGDFFEIPDQNLYPQIWQYQLSLHEYRHFAQMRKLYQGVGKAFYYIFGQSGPMALFGMFVPMWFVEGDAVYNETVYSKSGRGRMPSFWMDLKAQILEKRVYPYDKAVLGSYRDYVPDHYTLGYQLVQYGVQNYGYEMWAMAMDRVARRPYILKPFVNGLKKYSGLRKVKYYHKVMNTLQAGWKREATTKNITATEYLKIKKSPRSFTNYRFPVMLNDGSIIAEKTGIDDINRFVRIFPDGEEKVIFTPGFDYTESLSANDSLICWNEKQYDKRWSNRNFSIIKIYNFKTKRLTGVTSKTKLFAPDLSPDASKIVAVSVSETGTYSLVIVDAFSGKVISTFSTEDNLFFMTPKWSDDGRSVTATVLGKKGKSILLYHPETGVFKFVLPFGFTGINRPFKKGDRIVYTAAYDGTNNIYGINLTTRKVTQLSSVKYGAEDAVITKEGTLLFSDYTADGYRIAKLRREHQKKVTVNPVKTYGYPVDKQVTKNSFVLENTKIPDSNYKVQKYSRLKHLFNPHTWGPMLVDLNNYELTPNVTVASQNMLGTAVSTLGYYYDINEGTGKGKFTFDYYGWYPVIGFEADYGGRKQSWQDEDGNYHVATWQESNIKLNVSVPLRFIRNKWIRGFRPKVSIGESFIIQNGSLQNYPVDNITTLGYSVYLYNSLKRSKRDIYSKWSQTFYAVYNHAPFVSKTSHMGYLAGTFTFPGFIRHNGFKIYLAKEWKKTGYYSFSDYISVPRGYTGLIFNEMFALKADYYFPIAYPDLDIQSAAYFTRIYADLFFDYAWYQDASVTNASVTYSDIKSVGAELYTNWHFLSLPVNVVLGVRGTYKFNDSFKAEFLFGFGL